MIRRPSRMWLLLAFLASSVLFALLMLLGLAAVQFYLTTRPKPPPDLSAFGERAGIQECDDNSSKWDHARLGTCFSKYLAGARLGEVMRLIGTVGYKNLSFDDDNNELSAIKLWHGGVTARGLRLLVQFDESFRVTGAEVK